MLRSPGSWTTVRKYRFRAGCDAKSTCVSGKQSGGTGAGGLSHHFAGPCTAAQPQPEIDGSGEEEWRGVEAGSWPRNRHGGGGAPEDGGQRMPHAIEKHHHCEKVRQGPEDARVAIGQGREQEKNHHGRDE